MKKSLFTLLISSSLILPSTALLAADMSHEAMERRMQPIGQVVIGEASSTNDLAGTDIDGESIYNSKCMMCHGTGAAGAPKTGDSAAWKPRVAKGVDAMLATVKHGKGAMPPMGGCMDCSDAALKAAIKYIIGKT